MAAVRSWLKRNPIVRYLYDFPNPPARKLPPFVRFALRELGDQGKAKRIGARLKLARPAGASLIARTSASAARPTCDRCATSETDGSVDGLRPLLNIALGDEGNDDFILAIA